MKTQLLKRILIILIIIAITLIAFAGAYVKDKNTTRNIVKDNIYGMSLKQYRAITLIPNYGTEEVYYNSEGAKVEDSSDALDDEGNLKEGYTKNDESINKKEVLTTENYEKMKEIIEERLERLSVEEYNVRLDKNTGKIAIDLPENSSTDEVVSYLTYMGEFKIIDSESREVLIGSDLIKNVKVMYGQETAGTTIYLNVELNEEGKEKYKEITSKYVKIEDNNDEEDSEQTTESTENEEENSEQEENKEKLVTIQIEGQALLSTSFEKPVENGIVTISLGTATTNSAVSQYLAQANAIATIIGGGESKIEYTISENMAISPIISTNTIIAIIIATIVIVALGLILLIIKYKANGVYSAISYIGSVSLLYILIKNTNVAISIESIISVYAILIANYVFITCLLNKLNKGMNINNAMVEVLLQKLNIIIPIIVIGIVFTFIEWLPIYSVGMTLFWGVIDLILSNYLFTKNLLIEQSSKE